MLPVCKYRCVADLYSAQLFVQGIDGAATLLTFPDHVLLDSLLKIILNGFLIHNLRFHTLNTVNHDALMALCAKDTEFQDGYFV